MAFIQDRGVSIVDPFVQFYAHGGGLEVPIPKEALHDEQSRAAWPSSDMVDLFAKDPARQERDAIASDLDRWIANLDRWSITRAGVPVPMDLPDSAFDQLSEHSDRIFLHLRANPHDGMRAVKRIQELTECYSNIRSVSLTPFSIYPFIGPNSKEYFPIYTKCSELGLPIFINVGYPGPRVPAWMQDPLLLDEVCWFFPDLTIIMRHGGEPWVDSCIKMLLKWPNLYYATTAFAPKYYPAEIIDFLNRRGSGKIMYAGYWPTLPFDRIFEELAALPLKDEVVGKFLVENASRAFRLDAG